MAALLLLIASGGSVEPGIPFIGEDSAVEVPLCGDVADLNEGTLPISPVTLGASASASFASLPRIVFPAACRDRFVRFDCLEPRGYHALLFEVLSQYRENPLALFFRSYGEKLVTA